MVMLTWSVYGEDIISRELLRFESRNLNITPAAMAIIEDIKDSIGEQFGSEGGRASGGWAPLAESTLAAKAAGGYPETILHRTLSLLRSFVDPAHPDYVADAHPWGFTYGSNVEYGKFHQTGTVNMPARPPLEFTEADRVLWIKQLQRYIVTGELGVTAIT